MNGIHAILHGQWYETKNLFLNQIENFRPFPIYKQVLFDMKEIVAISMDSNSVFNNYFLSVHHITCITYFDLIPRDI